MHHLQRLLGLFCLFWIIFAWNTIDKYKEMHEKSTTEDEKSNLAVGWFLGTTLCSAIVSGAIWGLFF